MFGLSLRDLESVLFNPVDRPFVRKGDGVSFSPKIWKVDRSVNFDLVARMGFDPIDSRLCKKRPTENTGMLSTLKLRDMTRVVGPDRERHRTENSAEVPEVCRLKAAPTGYL
ncbi:hypothetical protein PQR70_17405 [Paraburkholderia madseniana]|uniref:hypothetical protein n=1 Tax=Paraburkholderia madseniana TaxID=2599607 RepID=UPI0038BE0FAF